MVRKIYHRISKDFDTRTIISAFPAYLYSGALAAIGAILGLIFGTKEYAVFYSMIGAFGGFYYYESKKLRDGLSSLEKAIINSGISIIVKFDDIQKADKYIEENVNKCDYIKNVRFMSVDARNNSEFIKNLYEMDQAICNFVKNEGRYDLVIAQDCLEHAKIYIENFDQDNSNSRIKIHVLDTRDRPMQQFTIMKYKTGKIEALVGWDFPGVKFMDEKIWLISASQENVSFIENFDNIFKRYQELGKIVNISDFYK